MINEADDTSINSLYDPTPSPALPHYSDSTLYILRMRSIAVLERVAKLMYLKPESGWQEHLRETMSTSPESMQVLSEASPPNWLDEYLAMDWAKDSSPERTDDPNHNASASSGKGWLRTARIRTPKAYDEVRQALMKIEADLPPERRTEWGTWDGKVQDWHLSSPKKEVTTLVS